MRDNTTICKYCEKPINVIEPDWLECIICQKSSHLLCLKRQCTPGAIHGDVFFKFTCIECSETDAEIFIREKMTWFQVIVLVMFHLQHRTIRSAKKGFFHWKTHLLTFVDQKWNILFPKDFKRRKNWIGTVSGCLSHYSTTFVTSGMQYLGESGWWRLTYPKLTPKLMYFIHSEFVNNKNAQSKVENSEIVNNKSVQTKAESEHMYLRQLIEKYAPHVFSEISIIEKENLLTDNTVYETIDSDCKELTSIKENSTENTVKLHHDCQITYAVQESFISKDDLPETGLKLSTQVKPIKTLFKNSTRSDFFKLWKDNIHRGRFSSNKVIPLRSNEENLLLEYVKSTSDRSAQALKRKLIVRSLKRKHGLPLFNADGELQSAEKIHKKDRFSHYGSHLNSRMPKEIRIASGNLNFTDAYISPYTNRLLKPYIRRDFKTQYPWLQLMAELQLRVNSKNDNWQLPARYPVDFYYVRPNHIAAINSLCERYFWPGIDLADALEYPDFSIVAMYKRLVIGFAFMVPDVKFNEIYISFIFTLPAWRKCGLAKFMLYHLIQTCIGKDVTLHVAIDNPALFLYQKFGFKVEEVALDFYDTYLREDSNHCRHAFLMRLER